MIPLGVLASRKAATSPGALVSDTFNRADGALGIADTGQTWVDGGYGLPFEISGQQARRTSTGTTGASVADAGTAEQNVSVTLAALGTGGVIARASSVGFPFYRLIRINATWYISAQSSAISGATLTSFTQTATAGDQMTLSAKTDGSAVILTAYRNGSVVHTITDSTYAFTGTYAGMWGQPGGLILDDFQVVNA